jgi:sulfur dioxygenase
VKSADEYVELMNGLKLGNPKMMDVAVPANIQLQENVGAGGLLHELAEATGKKCLLFYCAFDHRADAFQTRDNSPN